jgi:excinuclease ABC subunit A
MASPATSLKAPSHIGDQELTTTGPPAYYRTHSEITHPREYAHLFDALPRDVDSLVRTVGGLMLHPNVARKHGLGPEAEMPEERIRLVAEMVAAIRAIDDSPLTEAREPARRLVTSCRSPSLLLVGMLRHKGVPARKRVGFARYLPSRHNVIHEIAECWNDREGRWVLVDPALDERMFKGYRAFLASIGQAHRGLGDALDVRPEEFMVGAQVWRWCRAGRAEPDDFRCGDDRGMHWIGYALLHDLNALNKAELLSHDFSGGPLEDGSGGAMTVETLRFLDRAAELVTEVGERFDEMRRFYDESAWGSEARECLAAFPLAGSAS